MTTPTRSWTSLVHPGPRRCAPNPILVPLPDPQEITCSRVHTLGSPSSAPTEPVNSCFYSHWFCPDWPQTNPPCTFPSRSPNEPCPSSLRSGSPPPSSVRRLAIIGVPSGYSTIGYRFPQGSHPPEPWSLPGLFTSSPDVPQSLVRLAQQPFSHTLRSQPDACVRPSHFRWCFSGPPPNSSLTAWNFISWFPLYSSHSP